MQLYLEKDLMNISRNVQFNSVEDVLVKVRYFVLYSYYFKQKILIFDSINSIRV